MNWTRIEQYTLAIDAVDALKYYTKHLGLRYHNYLHVATMYEYLHNTQEPYDEALDWAVLFHDIVYDKEPEKEKRSAVMLEFNGRIPKYGLDEDVINRGYAMIMATADHIVSSPELSAIVRADLHGLADPITTIRNFANIMEESCNLYSIEPKEYAAASINFMTGLRERVSKNVTLDEKHSEFYKSVLNGIDLTIKFAKVITGEPT